MIIDLPECLPRLRRLLQEANDDGTDLLSVKLVIGHRIEEHTHGTVEVKQISKTELVEVLSRIIGYEAEGHSDELPPERFERPSWADNASESDGDIPIIPKDKQ